MWEDTTMKLFPKVLDLLDDIVEFYQRRFQHPIPLTDAEKWWCEHFNFSIPDPEVYARARVQYVREQFEKMDRGLTRDQLKSLGTPSMMQTTEKCQRMHDTYLNILQKTFGAKYVARCLKPRRGYEHVKVRVPA